MTTFCPLPQQTCQPVVHGTWRTAHGTWVYGTGNMKDDMSCINLFWYRAYGTDNMVDGTRGHLPASAVLCCSMCCGTWWHGDMVHGDMAHGTCHNRTW